MLTSTTSSLLLPTCIRVVRTSPRGPKLFWGCPPHACFLELIYYLRHPQEDGQWQNNSITNDTRAFLQKPMDEPERNSLGLPVPRSTPGPHCCIFSLLFPLRGPSVGTPCLPPRTPPVESAPNLTCGGSKRVFCASLDPFSLAFTRWRVTFRWVDRMCVSVHLLMDTQLLLAVVNHAAVNPGASRSVRFPFLWAQSRSGIAGSRDRLLGLAEGLRPGPSPPQGPSPPRECPCQAVLKLLGFPPPAPGDLLSAAPALLHQPASAPWATSSRLPLIPSPC